MSSSVINGAIGKSPVIEKMNQLTVEEVKSKTAMQMEQHVCGGGNVSSHVKYPSVPVSFPGCRKEIKEQLAKFRERRREDADL